MAQNSQTVSIFRNTTWPMSVSRHNKALKRGKIHCYNDTGEIAKTLISPSSQA